VICCPSFNVSVTRAGFNAGTAELIAGSSPMRTRWRRAGIAGSPNAEPLTANRNSTNSILWEKVRHFRTREKPAKPDAVSHHFV
jgi:hypothetical protein